NKSLILIPMIFFIKRLYLLLRNYKFQPFFINSDFSSGRVDFNYWGDINLKLNVLPTFLNIPLDYRTEKEINEQKKNFD
ncbi:hypothetical protein VB264_24915, partial [Arcicella aquatica]